MSDTQNTFDQTVNSYLEPLQNEYIRAALALFLILYAGVVAPKLPANILKWFDNIFVKIVVFFTIVWISKKDPSVALIASIAVLVTLMIANNQFNMQTTSDQPKREPFCSCNTAKSNGLTNVSDITYTPNDFQMEQVGYNSINGWYTANELDTENGIVEDEPNEPAYPDHNVQITKIVTPAPTTSAPKITRSSAPKITRLPMIDPEYPDHTHRMYTTVPAHVANNGKSMAEPSHPDHHMMANKKEHRIRNGYVAEPSHPDHHTMANKKEHPIINGYVEESAYPENQMMDNGFVEEALNNHNDHHMHNGYASEPSHPDHHMMDNKKEYLIHNGYTEESSYPEHQMLVNEKDHPILNDYSEELAHPGDMSLENIKKHYLQNGYGKGGISKECNTSANNKGHRAVNGFMDSESYHSV